MLRKAFDGFIASAYQKMQLGHFQKDLRQDSTRSPQLRFGKDFSCEHVRAYSHLESDMFHGRVWTLRLKRSRACDQAAVEEAKRR